MGRDHAVDGDMSWPRGDGDGFPRLMIGLMRALRAWKGKISLAREGDRQTFIIYSVNKHS